MKFWTGTAAAIVAVLAAQQAFAQEGNAARGQRLFNRSQDIAVNINHATCAGDGCERPMAWSELHHRKAWAAGGRTDLREAVPLCGFHHRRIHDHRYLHRYRSDGSVTFHQRT